MLRPRQQYRFLQVAFVFALIGVAFFGAYAGMQPYERGHEQTAKHEGPDIKPPETVWGWLVSDPVAAATILLCSITGALAVGTGFLAIYTFKLWRSTKTLVERADTTAQLELRAYLGFVGAEVPDFNAPSLMDDYVVSAKYMNRGQTPAHDVETWFSVKVFDFPLPANHDFGEAQKREDKWVMVPGADHTPESRIDISFEDRQALYKGDKAVFVWGKVTYRDVFGGGTTVYFRYRARRKMADKGWELRAEPEGNNTHYEK